MIIALSGGQRAGKDSVGAILKSDFGFKKVSLAQKIYDIKRDLFGVTEKRRDLLIAIGTHMRAIDPLVWVDYLVRTEIKGCDCDIVVTDMRFANEHKVLTSYFDAIPVLVDCSIAKRQRRDGYNYFADEDPSENELDGFSFRYTIDNNGSLEELRENTRELMKKLGR